MKYGNLQSKVMRIGRKYGAMETVANVVFNDRNAHPNMSRYLCVIFGVEIPAFIDCWHSLL